MSWDDFFCVCPYGDTYQFQLGLEFLVFPWLLQALFLHTHASFGMKIGNGIGRLFLRDLSSNSMSFEETLSESKRSSVISFMSDLTFFMLLLTMANSSSNLFWVNSRLFLISSTSSEIFWARDLLLPYLSLWCHLFYFRELQILPWRHV